MHCTPRSRSLAAVALSFFTLAACSARPLSPAAGDGAACSNLGFSVGPVHVLPDTSSQYRDGDGAAPIATAGWVVYPATRTLGANSATDLDLFAVEASTEKLQQLTADDLDTRLLDAEGLSILYAATAAYDKPAVLSLRTAASTRSLGSYYLSRFDLSAGYGSTPRRALADGKAVWAEELPHAGVNHGWAIYLFDGGSTTKIASGTAKYALGADPHTDGRSVVWSAWDGANRDVFLHRDGQVTQLTTGSAPDTHPVVDGSRVYWMCDSAICLWENSATQILDQGKCQPPDVHDGQAAWICDDKVTLHRAGQLTRVASGGDVSRSGLRIHGNKLAWLEVAPLSKLPEVGQLVLSDGARHVVVAQVGLPCIYCDAYWPPVTLSLADGVFAWSYAVAPGAKLPQPGSLAYARITDTCD